MSSLLQQVDELIAAFTALPTATIQQVETAPVATKKKSVSQQSSDKKTKPATEKLQTVKAKVVKEEKEAEEPENTKAEPMWWTEEVESMKYSPTHLKYWEDTYLFTHTSEVVAVHSQTPVANGTEEGQHIVILASTIFHAQGGGQPADTGRIALSAAAVGKDSIWFDVKHVLLHHDVVLHFGSFSSPENRRYFARLHSAGHLIDIATSHAGYTDWKATKGHHFPDAPSVEYAGKLPASTDKEGALAKIQRCLDLLIAESRPVLVRMVPYDQLGDALKVGGGGIVPSYLAVDKPSRVITFRGEDGCPCGGTHVRHSAEVGRVRLLELKKKGKGMRLKYVLEV